MSYGSPAGGAMRFMRVGPVSGFDAGRTAWRDAVARSHRLNPWHWPQPADSVRNRVSRASVDGNSPRVSWSRARRPAAVSPPWASVWLVTSKWRCVVAVVLRQSHHGSSAVGGGERAARDVTRCGPPTVTSPMTATTTTPRLVASSWIRETDPLPYAPGTRGADLTQGKAAVTLRRRRGCRQCGSILRVVGSPRWW
jgi:hypothetical protein